jgi:hypothetical protein
MIRIYFELRHRDLEIFEHYVKRHCVGGLTKWQPGKGFVPLSSIEIAKAAVREMLRKHEDVMLSEEVAREGNGNASND